MHNHVRSNLPADGPWYSFGWTTLLLGLAEMQLRDLGYYFDSAVKSVSEYQEAFTTQMADAAAEAERFSGEEGDEEAEHVFYGFDDDECNRLYNTFPSIVYSGTLSTAFSLFETSLTDLCKSIDKDNTLRKDKAFVTFDQDGLKRYAAFLRVNFGLDASSYSNWSAILEYHLIRHCCVHSNGDISLMRGKQQERLRLIVPRYSSKGISIDANDRLKLLPEFVREVINQLRNFWLELRQAFFGNEVLGNHFWPRAK